MANKGSGFEREIAKELGLWWTDGERDDIFWRTAMSGGRATVRRKKRVKTENSAGDLCYLDPIGKPLIDLLLIEIKRGYSNEVSVLNFLDKAERSKDPVLFRWWLKAEQERADAKRKWTVIIFKRDRHEKCIMLEYDFFSKLEQENGEWSSDEVIDVMYEDHNFIIVRYEDFFDWLSPQTIINIGKGD